MHRINVTHFLRMFQDARVDFEIHFRKRLEVPEQFGDQNLCLSAVREDVGRGTYLTARQRDQRSRFTYCHGSVIRGLKIHTKIPLNP